MSIGLGIKKIRKKRGFNQKVFAKNIKTTASYLSEVENGTKTPSIEFLKRVAEGLDIPHEVIGWYGVEKKDVHRNKQEIFDTIKPAVDELLEQFFGNNPLD
jgi:transcriptional regulator with XRE-family HTH domain